MILNLFNIIYVLVAIAMIALILLQRGAGAQAGSGFGGGASGTVFGARGASNFLSRSTAILAAVFFVLSLAMAWYLGRGGVTQSADDLGVMGGIEAPTPPKTPAPVVTNPASSPAANGDVPAAPASAAPAAISPTTDVPPPPPPAASPTEPKKDDAQKH